MTKFIKRLFCRHDYQPAGSDCVGATLSWGGRPTPQYSFHRDCTKWDEGGWPLDGDGERLPIARR